MSATQTTGRQPARSTLDGIRLSFGGQLNSEWIKLRSLRSTFWCLAIVVVLSLGLSAMVTSLYPLKPVEGMPPIDAQSLLVQAGTVGVGFTQLVAAVLGVLVIGGEYSTGMIRSTITAAPRRLGAIFAKVIVLAIVMFVVSVVAIGLSALLGDVILSARGLKPDFGAADVLVPLLGGAGYLALIAALAFALGTIIRNTAGGIAVILGAILVLPIVLSLVGNLTNAKWVVNVDRFLPSEAGARLYTYIGDEKIQTLHDGILTLLPWQGGLVLLGWTVIGLALAAVLVKTRDV